MIGYWGYLQFETNTDWLQYPSNFERTASGRWVTYYPGSGGRPVRQFLGAEVGEIEFTMHLDARFNSDIRHLLDEFVTWANIGYAGELVIGDKPMGFNKWSLEKCRETNVEILHKGVILSADVEVTLKEC